MINDSKLSYNIGNLNIDDKLIYDVALESFPEFTTSNELEYLFDPYWVNIFFMKYCTSLIQASINISIQATLTDPFINFHPIAQHFLDRKIQNKYLNQLNPPSYDREQIINYSSFIECKMVNNVFDNNDIVNNPQIIPQETLAKRKEFLLSYFKNKAENQNTIKIVNTHHQPTLNLCAHN